MATTKTRRKENSDVRRQENFDGVNEQMLAQIDEQARQQAMMEQMQVLNEGAKIQQQNQDNKNHDVELSEFSQGTGAAPTLSVIGRNEVEKAFSKMLEYRKGKTEIDSKIVENEKFWKLEHWACMTRDGGELADNRVKPVSAWLFNTIINKHADAMDNFPEANILPRAQDDEIVAKQLSSIIPVVLDQNKYEQTYSAAQWTKGKIGSSVQGVFWNNDRNNGLGDIEIKEIDILNLFWEPGVSDIQDSPNVFHVNYVNNEELRKMFPNIEVGASNVIGLTSEEAYGQPFDSSEKSPVVDWFYKRRVEEVDSMNVKHVRTILHYCKFCNGQVIYATENDPKLAQTGWYDHGLYPFVFDTLYPIKGSLVGIGYIDIVKDDQMFIDELQQAFLESAKVNARPRYWERVDGGVNEEEFLDLSKPIVHVEGNLDEMNIRPIERSGLDGTYVQVYLNKVQELKDTSGNTAASQGQASSTTSASGIASLQEAAGKLSRDANATSYSAFESVVNMVIELIRQFYDEPRCFRITGKDGEQQFTKFDNTDLRVQEIPGETDEDLKSRLPVMDIKVKPQKRNAYSKESQNQTALNLYGMGFFAPSNADAALVCLNMMEFEGIEKVRTAVQNNGTLLQLVMQQQQQIMAYQQQLQQLGMIVDAQNGTNLVEDMNDEAVSNAQDVARAAVSGTKTGGNVQQSNGSLSTQAASATRGSTAPR